MHYGGVNVATFNGNKVIYIISPYYLYDMTVKEITEMRKNGDLDGAYNECEKLLSSNPDDRYVRVAAAHCIKKLMERAASECDAYRLANLIEEYGALRLEEIDEQEMNNKPAWDLRALCVKMKEENRIDYAGVSRVCDALGAVCLIKPHRYYSIMLDSLLLIKEKDGKIWTGLIDYMDRWGLENLLPEDFERVLLTNGVRVSSLAERAYTAYVKCLIEELPQGRRQKEAENFVCELDLLVESHPEFQYTLYHKSLLLRLLGRAEEAINSARAFVKRKSKDFWSWSMLGDLVDDEELKLSCYCRALLCRTDPGFLVKVRQKAGVLMYRRGEYSNARREFDEILSVHQRKGWNVPQNVEEVTNQQWYLMTEPEYSNARYYYQHLAATEEFLLGDVPEVAVLITSHNPQKQTCSFVTDDRRSGYFSTKKMKERFIPNQIYLIRFEGEIGGKIAPRVVASRRDEDVLKYEDKLWRRIVAENSLHQGQNFTFIDNIYVDGTFLHGIPEGAQVSITATLYYNLKNETWGWRAVRVEPAQ